MSAALALQRALRARLVGTAAVTMLVPAANIIDRNQRPAPSPSIVLGEAQEMDAGTDIRRRQVRIFHTVHVWKREPSLEGAMIICAEIRKAVLAGHLLLETGLHCADAHVASIRTLRDPDGETSHGIVAIEAVLEANP